MTSSDINVILLKLEHLEGMMTSILAAIIWFVTNAI
jgi:hypothetical protein